MTHDFASAIFIMRFLNDWSQQLTIYFGTAK